MAQNWGATGALKLISFKLDKETRALLTDKLIDYHDIPHIPEEFFTELSNSITYYKSNLRIREKSKPGAVRDNLRTLLATASKLESKYTKLDGNSHFLIGEAMSDVDVDVDVDVDENGDKDEYKLEDPIKSALVHMVKIFGDALEMANEYPSSGSLPENEKAFLARDVADIIEKHLDRTATVTKKGIFASVLSIVLEAATNERRKSVHDLCRKGLEVVTTSSSGLKEYSLQDDE